MDFDLIKRILAALASEGVHYAVCGGAALNLHGLPRFTQDLDLFVEPEAENIARLRRALRSVFDDPQIDEITAEDMLGEFPAVQYVPPQGSFHLDILTRLGEAFHFADLECQSLDFDGVPVSVVTARQLYRMKKDTVRPQDRADAEALRRRFGFSEV